MTDQDVGLGSGVRSGVATTGPRRAAPRIAHIDALRAVAVMIVVLMHAGLTIAPGDGGVTLFFCVSGYIITSLMIKERVRTGGFRIGGFYARRLLKLAPPLLVLVVLPTLVYAAFRPVSWGAVLSQVGFTYNWVAVVDPAASLRVLPGSEVVWSLAIEEQFYIGFAVVWILLLRVQRWRTALTVLTATTIVASFLMRVHLTLGQPATFDLWDEERYLRLWRGTDTRIEAIAIGVLLALALDAHSRGGLRWLGRLGSGATLVVAAALFVSASVFFRDNWAEGTLRPSAQAWSAALVIAFGLLPGSSGARRLFEREVARGPLQLVGRASYSIYLAHTPVIHLLAEPLAVLPPPAQLLVNVAAGTAVGLVAYRFIEVPVLRLRGRRVRAG